METTKDRLFEGERAEFGAQGKRYEGCTFRNGESPLKESRDISLEGCTFEWKYPLWYAHRIEVKRCRLKETARSGIWYTKAIAIQDSLIEAPKTFRRAEMIILDNAEMPNAKETMWGCKDVKMRNVKAVGDYFGMNAQKVRAWGLKLDGNYCFDGGSDILVENSYLNSKDSFWNCTDVVVRNSTIIGEYIGWNSRNLTFENCTIESLQGLCYIKGLKLINCQLKGTSLSFEYCENIDADIDEVDSIFNPTSGVIRARRIGELVQDPARVNPQATQIILKE